MWGTYRRLKWIVLWIALGVYYILPFIRWSRGPNEPSQAVLVDMAHSRFYAFFIELWPQEVYYFTGLLILAALVLFLSNALFGRVWCGYACPQTVWTDLFLWVERAIEGDRRERIKLDAAPWDGEKIAKRIAKHAAWLVIALLTGGAAVLYFQDAPTLVGRLSRSRRRSSPICGSGFSPSPPIPSPVICANRSASTCAPGRASRLLSQTRTLLTSHTGSTAASRACR